MCVANGAIRTGGVLEMCKGIDVPDLVCGAYSVGSRMRDGLYIGVAAEV